MKQQQEIAPSLPGIWKHKKVLPKIKAQYLISLGEGDTGLTGHEGIYFKHEYENPTGSVKDRGICFQIASLLSKGIKSTCLSSSGNAAISAARYCRLAGINLTIFLSPKINKSKLFLLKKEKCKIIMNRKPVSACFLYAKEKGIFNLRQSTDPNALYGFETIAFEIMEKLDNADAVFIPVSSATTLSGVAAGFALLKKKVQIHAVQTEAVHPIAGLFDHDFKECKKSIADAIVARYTARGTEVVKIIKNSEGWGWVVSDKEVRNADEWLKNRGIICSFEGALALSGLLKAKSKGFAFKNPVCLLTGKKYD